MTQPISRRKFVALAGLAPLAVAGGAMASAKGEEMTVAASGETTSPRLYELPPLPYPPEALEPHIDAETMRIHHGKHHAAYVKNANAALEKFPNLSTLSVEELLKGLDETPEEVRQTLRNNAGGHANHSLFWSILSPTPMTTPEGLLADQIKAAFGGLEEFKTQFNQAATKVFGSGWAWLSLTADDNLIIETTPNQDSPIMHGNKPLLGLDVWEHAYYLKHQNRRADYIAAFWNVLDWSSVAKLFGK